MTDLSHAFIVEVRTAVRAGTYRPDAAEDILAIGRLVTAHAARDYDVSDLYIAYAMAVQIDWSGQLDVTKPLDETVLALTATAWAMLSSPNGLKSEILKTLPRRDPKVADVLAAVRAKIAADEADRARAQVENPATLIGEIVKAAAAEHPRLGLSFGYIGNVWPGPNGDDRSWRVFTKLATPRCHSGCDISFGQLPTKQLGDLLVAVERRLPAWIAEQERRLDAGEIRQVGVAAA